MSLLDHLKDYRVVKVDLPLEKGEQQLIDGVAKVTSIPQFEITFLPDQLKVDQLNRHESCQVSFEVSGENKSLRAKVVSVVDGTKLLMEQLESNAFAQKRAYFRVDTELPVSYWVLSESSPLAKSIKGPINISGGGMRLPVDEDLPDDIEIGLELILEEPQPRIIECVAKVVRTYDMGSSGKQIAISFVEIDDEDQDAIVSYCLAEQRKQLRLKVQMGR